LQLRDIKNLLSAVTSLDLDYVFKWAQILGAESYLEKAMPHE